MARPAGLRLYQNSEAAPSIPIKVSPACKRLPYQAGDVAKVLASVIK